MTSLPHWKSWLCASLLFSGCARGVAESPKNDPGTTGGGGTGATASGGGMGSGGMGMGDGGGSTGDSGGMAASGSAAATGATAGTTTGDAGSATTGGSNDCEKRLDCASPKALNFKDQGDGTFEATFVDATFNLCDVTSPASCEGDIGVGGVGPEAVHEVTMPLAGTLEISVANGGAADNLGPQWNASAYVLTTCGDPSSSVGCGGALSTDPSPFTVMPAASFAMGDKLFVVVDSGGAMAKGSKGSYRLTVVARP